MQYKKVSRIKEEISVTGFGCWSSAGYNWTDGSVEGSIRAIHTAMDNGVNFFDVAPIYGYGESEKVLGQAIKGRRDQIFLATKCGLRWVEKDTDGINNLTKESILEEIDMSLKRLDVEYVDLLQMHWPDHNTPIDETMEAMASLVKAGKVRYIGASNFSAELIEEADKIAPIASHQVLYNMFDRNSDSYCNIPLDYRTEKEIMPQCEAKGIAMIPYSPLCQGVLSGRFYRGRDKDLKKGDMRLTNPAILGDELDKKLDVVDKLKVIADEAGLTLLELAMGWLISKPAITTIICGSRTPEQALTSAKAGDVVLSQDVLDAIAKVLPEA
ncbi:aldo/keto reductase [Christensenellaceae bacterium NSJ-63]|uniref:Aldo/keto reductase n=1 Tax=Guopingia tenuis TaxID=2763656 RepID=A0A926DG58_9FIRM|nr:aldo/keto reductase [Guopingia tenuis]MBC8537541.1 aldo/keto reductase [Guopingia tenuis]